MKPLILTIFLLSILFLNVKAQDSEEISQLKPVQKLTKAKLKKLKKLSKDSYDPFDIQTIDLFVQIETKILSNNKKVSLIKAEFKSNSLFFKGIDKEESVATLNTFGKITSNDKNIEGIFEDAVNFVLTKAGPLPGFTCKNSTTEKRSLLNLITSPFLMSAVVAIFSII